ncbi:hypothetical protein HMPREF0765_3726 [Sphingobacterium spiritivorum ATCC 33300]|uniref:Uncharacterized protein n=1 Tax=Sphingobacterium spiritivorum ATCC 33300 TaxID=525372 RepID=C2G2C0_SPHSI|nr:hypothetical protein HMPREF0765_3726 [Sphingobacterium spiritivorum ATCC 33300]
MFLLFSFFTIIEENIRKHTLYNMVFYNRLSGCKGRVSDPEMVKD